MLTPLATKLLLLATCHFLGDFPFQSVWMVMEKGKSWEVLLYHVCVYTVTFVPLLFVPDASITLIGLGVVFASHFLIDTCKARWNIIKTIWADQLWHLFVLAVLALTGWM